MRPPSVPDAPSAIYWMRTAAVHPDAGYGPDVFMAFDPAVRFPRFHMETSDETIGNVRLIEGGPAIWALAMVHDRRATGAALWRPHQRHEASRGAAGRRVVEVYRHYLSTRPEQYPRRA